MADESLRRALMVNEGSFLPLFDRPIAVLLLLTIIYFVVSQFFPLRAFILRGIRNLYNTIRGHHAKP